MTISIDAGYGMIMIILIKCIYVDEKDTTKC